MANRKQKTEKRKRAGAATQHKPPMNRAVPPGPSQGEFAGITAFVLTNRVLPNVMLNAIAEAAQRLEAVYLYCKADAYTPSMRPVEFGAAIALIPAKHSGQVIMVRLYNEDANIPVETEELGVITSFEALQEAWQNTFDMVWIAETELLEIVEPESTEGSDLDTPPPTEPQT